MVLLAIASCLLFFVTWFTGVFIQKCLGKFFRIDVNASFFETFLYGLIACFIWFNLLSFFYPVNYWALLPPLFISCITFFKQSVRQQFVLRIQATAGLFFSKKNIFIVGALICNSLFYWVVPPLNVDTPEYHILAIRWYEKYKVIPGLANVHGRLGFNPASFIISSAWSFTNITGQSLYPLNGVLALLFYVWLFKKILTSNNHIYSTAILLLSILLYRITLINISSPSADLLAGILLFYCGCKTYDLLKENNNSFSAYFPVFILTSFAVTAKLSAIPSLLLLPYIYFFVVKKDKNIQLSIKYALLIALIAIPWLARNFILSGYFLYPVPSSNLFSADWAVPHNVIKLDYLFSKYGPRTITVDFVTMQKMNLLQLIKTWLDYMLFSSLSSLIITATALLTPFAWLLLFLLKRPFIVKTFFLWGIYYVCTLTWFINAPEHRFGLAYLALTIGITLLELVRPITLQWKAMPVLWSAIMWFCAFHYYEGAIKMKDFYSFSLSDCWFKPLMDINYVKTDNKPLFLSGYKTTDLGNNVKLYYNTRGHDCLNADGPCMEWEYGQIEMRGTKIEDGFRNTKDEVQKYFPFVSPAGGN